MSYILAGIFI